ncbi:MAG: type IV pilus assembly protein PilM, partial [bacterium]
FYILCYNIINYFYYTIFLFNIKITMSLFTSINSYLGVDIGSSNIKIVELAKDNERPRLLTYGFSEDIKNFDWQKNVKTTAQIINKICDEAGVSTKSAIAALPTFSVFSSVLNLSNVNKRELSSAIHWEAKKVIPLPLDEMILDWQEIKDGANNKNNNIKVLLTGAPRTLINKYIEIFKEARINLLSLETETFSLIRSILGNDKSRAALVEIGAGTTDVSIVDKGIPMFNRSINVGGMTITKALSRNLNITTERAEQFKYDLGISSIDSHEGNVPKIIIETVSPIVNEIKYALSLYEKKNKGKVDKIILSGGSSLLPNLPNYLSKILNIKVVIGDPWSRIQYHQDLRPLLNEIGPGMSVAVGLALRNMD